MEQKIPETGQGKKMSHFDVLLREMICGFMLLTRKEETWIIQDYNPAISRLTGLTQVSRGFSLCDLFPDSCYLLLEMLEESERSGESVNREIELPEINVIGNVIACMVDETSSNLIIYDLTEKEMISRDLRERNKELNCLYHLSRIVETPGIGITGVLERTVDILPAGFRFPEKTGVYVYLEGLPRENRLFNPDGKIMEHPIQVFGGRRGVLRISLPDEENLMFLDEERKLAEAFASRLGVIIEKIRDEERIRELSSRLIESQENERRRVACDLHDGPIQTMLVSKINIAEYIKAGGRSNPLLERGLQLMDRALSDLREVCDDLYPSVLEDIGISAAINRYCENYLEPNGIEVIKEFSVPSDCSSHYQENLYRISQELLSNVMKHSGADTVYYTLTLTRDPDGTGIYLEVTDNGLGFDIADSACQGTGLRSIQFRAEALDCRFHVISEEGNGARAIVTSRKDYVPDKGLYSG